MMARSGMLACLAALATAAVAADDVTLSVVRTRPVIDPVLVGAYDALMAGDFAVAASGYSAILARDPRNADALHGVAAIALRRDDRVTAAAHYRLALDLDPVDAIAHAGLLGLGYGADAVLGESRLKSLIAAQPEQHVLRFALGNIYAEQARWQEAQQQYRLAHAGDPGQPDYLFNLAVSHNHLRQTRLAREHFEAALAAAARRPALFDPAQATTALRALETTTP